MKIVRRLLALFVLIPLLTLVTSFLFGFLFDLVANGGSWNQGGRFFWGPSYFQLLFLVGVGLAYIFWLLFFVGVTKKLYDFLLAIPFLGLGLWWQLNFGPWQIVPGMVCAGLGFYFGTLARKKTEKILKREINL